ncbi:MAG: GNAT family N-acetyltransferase [Rhodovibrionaceae bacterium]|nr:GNAT family N-acetyltransferase [Rhodovibrionaceae bacterium]
MPDGADRHGESAQIPQKIEIHILGSIHDAPAREWDACAGIDGMKGNPFLSHAFLSALEDSGSAAGDTGWLPQHLAIRGDDGGLLACAPCYLKSHSFGEYVFDWGWADAWERAGGQYYPKLQSSVPFTPVTGPRLLVREGLEAKLQDQLRRALAAGMQSLAKRHRVSSLHVTFPTHPEWDLLGDIGLLQRRGVQYHWHNDGYADFDAFLAALASRKRKQIRKERREVEASGIALTAIHGQELGRRHWDAFYRFYRNTTDKRWGQAYLTREFFDLLGQRLGDRVVLVLAEEDGLPVAGALNLRDDEALYGRNWGCLSLSGKRDYRFLHFEACYYQAIDYAIAHGLRRVEAGAQGEHKIQRGYLPVETFSAHWIADPRFEAAVADFLRRENQAVDMEIAELTALSPYRKGGG